RDMNKMCAGCHERYRIITIHARWLPQTERHIEMLPCITCHTGSENYLVSIYIVRRQELGKFALASYDELNRLANGKNILSLIDGNADNRISLAALRNFNRNLANAGYRLQGVMSPERVTHSFQILNNRRQCSFCHAVGPGIMQSGFIVISDKDGGFRRVQVEKGAVMEALYGKNFYMTGKMRTKAFDKVIFLTVAGVFSISAGYGFFCYLLRKKRRSSRNNNPDELA